MAAPRKDRELEVYDFIVKFSDNRHYPPSIREIAEAMGTTPANVHRYLARLKEEGAVNWDPNGRRTIHVTGERPRGSTGPTVYENQPSGTFTGVQDSPPETVED